MPSADYSPASSDRAVRVALARHESAPGGDHLDLFVGPVAEADGTPDPDARTARCWRLPLSAWTSEGLACGRFAATELEPHRAAYLSLDAERALSDGRGRVVPLTRGPGRVLPPLTLIALGRRLAITPGWIEITPDASAHHPEGHPHAEPAH